MLGDLLPEMHHDDCCSTCNCSPCCCQHVEVLKQLSSKKYQLILAYIHYGDQLRAMYRDGIYEHFKEHMKEERAQLYEINKKITAMGSDAPCTPGPVPPVPLDNARAIFKSLLSIEEESVSLWSKLFHETDDDVALNGMAQTYATECRGHADDLRRYLRSCE
jgi:ferritin